MSDAGTLNQPAAINTVEQGVVSRLSGRAKQAAFPVVVNLAIALLYWSHAFFYEHPLLEWWLSWLFLDRLYPYIFTGLTIAATAGYWIVSLSDAGYVATKKGGLLRGDLEAKDLREAEKERVPLAEVTLKKREGEDAEDAPLTAEALAWSLKHHRAAGYGGVKVVYGGEARRASDIEGSAAATEILEKPPAPIQTWGETWAARCSARAEKAEAEAQARYEDWLGLFEETSSDDEEGAVEEEAEPAPAVQVVLEPSTTELHPWEAAPKVLHIGAPPEAVQARKVRRGRLLCRAGRWKNSALTTQPDGGETPQDIWYDVGCSVETENQGKRVEFVYYCADCGGGGALVDRGHHHCYILNNCIAAKNLDKFIYFLAVTLGATLNTSLGMFGVLLSTVFSWYFWGSLLAFASLTLAAGSALHVSLTRGWHNTAREKLREVVQAALAKVKALAPAAAKARAVIMPAAAAVWSRIRRLCARVPPFQGRHWVLALAAAIAMEALWLDALLWLPVSLSVGLVCWLPGAVWRFLTAELLWDSLAVLAAALVTATYYKNKDNAEKLPRKGHVHAWAMRWADAAAAWRLMGLLLVVPFLTWYLDYFWGFALFALTCMFSFGFLIFAVALLYEQFTREVDAMWAWLLPVLEAIWGWVLPALKLIGGWLLCGLILLWTWTLGLVVAAVRRRWLARAEVAPAPAASNGKAAEGAAGEGAEGSEKTVDLAEEGAAEDLAAHFGRLAGLLDAAGDPLQMQAMLLEQFAAAKAAREAAAEALVGDGPAEPEEEGEPDAAPSTSSSEPQAAPGAARQAAKKTLKEEQAAQQAEEEADRKAQAALTKLFEDSDDDEYSDDEPSGSEPAASPAASDSAPTSPSASPVADQQVHVVTPGSTPTAAGDAGSPREEEEPDYDFADVTPEEELEAEDLKELAAMLGVDLDTESEGEPSAHAG